MNYRQRRARRLSRCRRRTSLHTRLAPQPRPPQAKPTAQHRNRQRRPHQTRPHHSCAHNSRAITSSPSHLAYTHRSPSRTGYRTCPLRDLRPKQDRRACQSPKRALTNQAPAIGDLFILTPRPEAYRECTVETREKPSLIRPIGNGELKDGWSCIAAVGFVAAVGFA
jgi:hypothetical protein